MFICFLTYVVNKTIKKKEKYTRFAIRDNHYYYTVLFCVLL